MRKIVGFFTIMTILIFSTSVVMANSVEFRTIVNKNDATVGGDFFLDLEMRIASSASPKTLNSLTVDVYYGPELTEWSANAGTGWAFGSSLGYIRSANKNSGYYRVLATGGGVNEDEVECPGEGSPPGWDVTDSWQKIVTLRWTIAEATAVNISIADNTDAAAYFDKYQNCFPQPIPAVENLTVTNQDLEDTSLPVLLSSFTATYGYDSCVLKWTTQTEVNNLGFYIYRSKTKDGEYTKVNKMMIEGAGNSAMPTDYQFADTKVEPGKTYFYYLENVDITGEKNKNMIIKVVIPAKLPPPEQFALLQNFPNPFNPETWIPYNIAKDADVSISIYNIQGQLVRKLDIGKQMAGRYTTQDKAAYWDGRDDRGEKVASGVYWYTLRAGEFEDTRRMLIVK